MIASPGMNNQQLGDLIATAATAIHENQLGFWKFEFSDTLVFVITDESHNRMRIMAPVADLESVSNDSYATLLAANYDRALDARYCINENAVWSAYLHPLRELNGHQFLDALKQVVTLSKNFGTTFASSDLVFGG